MAPIPVRIKGKEAAVAAHLDSLFGRCPQLEPLKSEIEAAYEAIARSFEGGGRLLVCGNGGSAADADHIVGELMKGFYKQRPLPPDEQARIGPLAAQLQGALPALSLTHHTALSTAFLNDVEPTMVFAQQVYGFGRPGDCLLCISTSGNAKNVCAAAEVAGKTGLAVIGLTGAQGGSLRALCGVCLRAPANVTAEVQELHLPIYHTLCAMLEEAFFA
ncbi:SIS domain-containing protein [Ruminococcaceae bacterium OttesenSCG-928-D13]|nr:SIS domain-containing protein [Ruminococcaceae bacterium OttesenSCG-928-D13]